MNTINILSTLPPGDGPAPGESIPLADERVAARYVMPLLAGIEHLLSKLPAGSHQPDTLPGFALTPEARGHLRLTLTWEGPP